MFLNNSFSIIAEEENDRYQEMKLLLRFVPLPILEIIRPVGHKNPQRIGHQKVEDLKQVLNFFVGHRCF